MTKILRFKLYEETVQSPNWQVDYLPQFHHWLSRRKPLRFREDFCGTGRIACEWVKRNPRHSALGLDLDPDALRYAREVNRRSLAPGDRRRIRLRRQNVLRPTVEKFDWVGAFNYSIFTFLARKDLLRYFRAVHQSLHGNGTVFLEIAGGPDFLKASTQKRSLRIPGIGRVVQAWEQQDWDPMTCINDYSIHFKLPDGTWLADAFHYHWRIWSLPEIRETLTEAGFRKTVVLLEKDSGALGSSDEFLPSDSAPNSPFFIAYVIGLK